MFHRRVQQILRCSLSIVTIVTMLLSAVGVQPVHAQAQDSPWIEVSTRWDWLNLREFTPWGLVQLTLEAQDGSTLFSEEFVTDGGGNIWFGKFEPEGMPQPMPGMALITEDLTTHEVKRLEIFELSFDYINYEDKDICGIAPPGTDIQVSVYAYGEHRSYPTTSGSEGHWCTSLAPEDPLTAGVHHIYTEHTDGDGDSLHADLYVPQMVVNHVENWIHFQDFPQEVTVTVTIESAEGETLYSGEYQLDEYGQLHIDSWQHGVNLAQGMTVTAVDSSGSIQKSLYIPDFTLQQIDAGQDLLTGTASPGLELVATAGGFGYHAGMLVTANQDGVWVADFTQIDLDLLDDGWGSAAVYNAQGDYVQATLPPLPAFQVSITYDWLQGFSFQPGSFAELRVYDEQDNLIAESVLGPADEWGTVTLDQSAVSIDFTPGQRVTLTDTETGVTKELILTYITVDTFDFFNDTISGTAPPFTTLEIRGGNLWDGTWMNVEADSEGNWLADFKTLDPPFNLIDDMNFEAVVTDADGDQTIASRVNPPVIEGWLISNDAIARYITPWGEAELTYNGETLTQTANEYGDAHFWYGGTRWDLQPGNTLRLVDVATGYSTELLLEDISIDHVDYDNSIVTGRAPNGKWVRVGADRGDYRAVMEVKADETDGSWTADFNQIGEQLNRGYWITASVYDDNWNYTLAEALPYPHIDLWVDAHGISAYDWPVGATLTLTIEDEHGAEYYTDTQENGRDDWNPDMGFTYFQLPEGYTLQPGYQVTVTDGVTTQTSVVANLQLPEIDQPNSRIFGVAEEGAFLWSNLCNNQGCAYRSVIAGPGGAYELNFAVPNDNPGEDGIVWMQPGDGASLNWMDGNGNQTSLYWRLLNPTIQANPYGRWVQGRGWPKGTWLQLFINDEPRGSAMMDQAPWNPGDPNDLVAIFNDIDLAAGDELTLTDGAISRSLTIADFQITEINIAASTVSGWAWPEAFLQVCVNSEQGCILRHITADDQGRWTASFAEPGQDPGDFGTITFTPGVNGWAAVFDDDGDCTWIDWEFRMPNIQASVQAQYIFSFFWEKGTEVFLKINGVPAGSATAEQAPWNSDDPRDIVVIFQLDETNVIKAGDVITVSNADGSVSKTLVLADFQVTEFSDVGAQVSGIAWPNAWVTVNASTPEGNANRSVQADENGYWTADFAVEGTEYDDYGLLSSIEPGANGWATAFDEDGDHMRLEWRRLNPTVDVWMNGLVFAHDWPMGAEVALTILDPQSELLHSDVLTVVPAPWDIRIGIAEFNISEIITLAPGQQVTVTDGNTFRSTTVVNLLPPDIDIANSTLSGTAAPGADISACVDTPEGCLGRKTTAGEDGTYLLDFGNPGSDPEKEPAFQLQPGYTGSLYWSDSQGNTTARLWNIPRYFMHVNRHDQDVHGHEWPLGATVTLTLDDPVSGAHQEASQTVVDIPECGAPCFQMRDLDWTLAAGQTVTISDGVITKTVVVGALEITAVDALHDRIAGTADPGALIEVNIWSQNGIARVAQADSNGYWMVDFARPGELDHEQEIADIVPGDHGSVVQYYLGGYYEWDGTKQNWWAGDMIQLSRSDVDENVDAGTAVGILSLVSSDAGQEELVYSLVDGDGADDNADFYIDGTYLRISHSPDFETKAEYHVRVRVVDSLAPGLSFEQPLTITVNDVNEPPQSIALTASSVDENVSAGSLVGYFSAKDPDAGDTVTYTLVSGHGDNDSFSISGNSLFIVESPDYETQSSYSIRVRATDSGGLWFEQVFTITVNDLPESATDILLSNNTINENVTAGSLVGVLSAAGGTAGQSFTFSLVDGFGDNSAFTINENELIINVSPDFEAQSVYSIRVRATDSADDSLTFEKTFTINVQDVNEAPTNLLLSSQSISENTAPGAVVGTFTAEDPDQAQSLTFSLVDGEGSADNNAFTITGNTLTINQPADYETKSSYAIRVRVTDSGGLWFEQVFTITVNDVNEAPTSLTLSSTSINENTDPGAVVGTFNAEDPEEGQTFTYSLVSGSGDSDNSAFTITGNTLTNNQPADYEAKPTYSIRVRVTDSGSPAQWLERTFTITVIDVNDAPSDLALSNDTIMENAPPEARVIGTFSAVDQDQPAQNFTYSLVNGAGSADNAYFSIAGSTLSIKAAPDFETKSSYAIRVRVTDSGSPALSFEKALTVAVINVVEQPVVSSFNKSGLQDTAIPFTAADFSNHFIDLEAGGSGTLERIQITGLPAHGVLRVGDGPALAANDEVPAADLDRLVYVPATGYSGGDQFTWRGANSAGYSENSAQVSLDIGFVARYGLQVSPAGDAKTVKPGTTAAYTLVITNTGNTADSYSISLVGAPKWTTTFTPSQATALPAGAQANLTVNVAVPSGATGSDEAVLKITSVRDASKTVTVRLTTTAAAAPVVPVPVLLGVSPASASVSALNTTVLTLSGANFTDPMHVTIGGKASPQVTRESSAALTAKVPTGLTPDVYTVQVCNTSAKCASLPDAFTVLDNTPRISGVYPNQGYNDAPNRILILGYNLTAATTFQLVGAGSGEQPVNIAFNAGQVQATIPAGITAGTYDLQACNGTACSVLVSAYTALDVIKNDFSASAGDLWTAPATVREGNTVLLGLNVHRLSGVDLASAEVAFYCDDPTRPENKISPAVNPSTGLMAPGAVEAVAVAWTPTGFTGAVKIFAVIDPDGLLTEATKANNIVSTTIQVLPREEKDETAPVITALTINNGAETTGAAQVTVNLQAVDHTPGAGVQTMNLVERAYNTSARQWVIVQETGWIPYQASTKLTLTPEGGVHYIQAWVADGAGNTSEIAQARINYLPAQDSVAAGQVRIYRLSFAAGSEQHIALHTLSGDADLYIWDPDGNLVASSINADSTDRVDFTPRVNGLYQIEVYGYLDSTYTVDFQAPPPQDSSVRAFSEPLTTAPGDKVIRTQPTILTRNEPLNNIPNAPAPIAATPDVLNLYLPFLSR